MKTEKISIKEAQRIVLSRQKLIGPVQTPLEIINHLGYVQIDTISVVERAHHHVFWTRNSKYRPEELESLVRQRKVFEHWSHAASYLPMQEYRFSLPLKREFSKRTSSFFPRDTKVMKQVMKRILNEGPLRSADFKNSGNAKSSGWWDWKPAKKALERLFLEGQLEITRRDGFQKVYDLPERVIPSSVNTNPPSHREYIRYLIQRTLRHHGLATASEVAYLQKKKIKDDICREFLEMQSAGETVLIRIEGIEEPYYAAPDVLEALPRIQNKVFIYSPFDNLVIQRKKLKRLFNFEYQIECYVPEAKRKYGYFCLPVFLGNTPVARMDCKADRKQSTLFVKSMHFEKGVDRELLNAKLESKLKSYAKFNGCRELMF